MERERDLIHLPRGFSYVAFSPAGARMSECRRVPGAHDGMRAFRVPGQPDLVRLVRTSRGQTPGVVLPTHWVPITDPDPENAEANSLVVLDQGTAQGAATFAGLEGLYLRDGAVYFSASDGGHAGRGQIWKYISSAAGSTSRRAAAPTRCRVPARSWVPARRRAWSSAPTASGCS